jgi:hypothetical protein
MVDIIFDGFDDYILLDGNGDDELSLTQVDREEIYFDCGGGGFDIVIGFALKEIPTQTSAKSNSISLEVFLSRVWKEPLIWFQVNLFSLPE